MDFRPGDDEYRRAAEFYDYVTPYRARQDLAFFVEMARDCGTGRVRSEA